MNSAGYLFPLNHLLGPCLVYRRRDVHRQGVRYYVEHLQTEEYGYGSWTLSVTHTTYHPDIQTLCTIHLIAKIGFQANDAVTDLKLVEKGLSKEDLALVVLIDFPFQILGGWLAGRWSVGEHKLLPWLHGYWIRLGFALMSMGLVRWFPRTGPVPTSFLLLVILIKVLASFAGYVVVANRGSRIRLNERLNLVPSNSSVFQLFTPRFQIP